MKNIKECLNEFMIELNRPRIETKALSEESMTKVCIIEDLVKLHRLDNIPPPTWEDFCYMYDMSLVELHMLEHNIITYRQIHGKLTVKPKDLL